MKAAGFTIMGQDDCPIAPVFFGDGGTAGNVCNELFDRFNIYVSAFSFPVVPKGEARIRCIYTGAHSKEQIEKVVHAFITVGREQGLIPNAKL